MGWHDAAGEGGYGDDETFVEAVVYDTTRGNCGGAGGDNDGGDIDIGDRGGYIGEVRNNAGEERIDGD